MPLLSAGLTGAESYPTAADRRTERTTVITRRERVLMVGVLSLVLVLGLAMLFHLFFYRPIMDIKDQVAQVQDDIAKKQDELAKENKEIAHVLRVNPRLAEWRKISLPAVVLKDNQDLKRG